MDRKIEAIYAEKRKVADRNLELHMNQIRSQFPEVIAIKNDIASVYLKLGRAKISDDKDTESKLIKELEVLKAKKESMLKENGIDDDFFKIKYSCENCKDTGYLSTNKGRVKCSCLRLEEAKILYENSNMLSRLNRENFNSFDISIFDEHKNSDELFSQRENMMDIMSDVKAYVKGFDTINGKGLIFYGGVGLGKSFLCSCIGKELIDRGKRVLYYSTYDLMKLLSKFTFEKSGYAEAYPLDDYRKLDKVDLLIIDDLGSELTNSFVISELFNIINSRILKGKSTVVSTNLDITGLEDRYGERLYSRFLMHFSFYKFIGTDVRRKL